MTAMNAGTASTSNVVATDVAFAVGGVLVAGGVAWFVMNELLRHDDRRSAFRFVPSAGPGPGSAWGKSVIVRAKRTALLGVVGGGGGSLT